MKKGDRRAAVPSSESVPDGRTSNGKNNNGHSTALAEPVTADLSVILASLQTMRDGDFSVRLPGSWTAWQEKSPTRLTTSLPRTSKWRTS